MTKIRVVLAAAILAGAITACGAAAPAPAGSATGHPAPGASAPATHAQSPSAAEIAARLKAAGLPVSALITYTAVTDPNHLLGRQGEYTSKVAWQDPRAIAAGAGQLSRDAVLAAGFMTRPRAGLRGRD
jgi:hypothetical protein